LQELINAVVIDDDINDIIGVSTALAKMGLATVPVHYTAPRSAYLSCEGASTASPRVIITDIQMNDGGREPSRTDLGNVAKCLEKVVSGISGPYIILAWTSIATSFQAMKDYVEEYFVRREIEAPVYFSSICKNECKPDGLEYCGDTIFANFSTHLQGQSELRALMHWEKTVLRAAAESVNEIAGGKTPVDVHNSLYALAREVAGSNLIGNEATAINEALSYILKDKLAHLSISPTSKSIWHASLNGREPTAMNPLNKAALNTSLHLDKHVTASTICPGDVWIIDQRKKFFNLISATNEEESIEQRLLAEFYDDFAITNEKVILMEASPACDFAQGKKSFKTLAIGLIIPIDENTGPNGNISKKIFNKKKETVIGLPIIFNDIRCILCISLKHSVAMSAQKIFNLEKKIGKRIPILHKAMRVRESLLVSWIQAIAFHSSRIGTISFK